MTILKNPSLEAFLRRPDSAIRAVLVFGAQPASIRDVAARLVKRLSGSTDDPFLVVKLDDGDFGARPSLLAEEVDSLSMLGGNRVVWVTDCDSHFVKAVEPLLQRAETGNVIVAEAGNLGKSSPLRNLFEKSDVAAAVAVYDLDGDGVETQVLRTLSEAGLRADDGAMARLVGMFSGSSSTLKQEVEKLVCYCQGLGMVTAADVDAVCGFGGEVEIDALVDAVFGGAVDETDLLFSRLMASGTDAGRLASACLSHAVRLQDMKLAASSGHGVEQAMRQARPAVFFKRMVAVGTQLRNWETAGLLRAAARLSAAIAETRQTGAISEPIVGRSLLDLARNARLALEQQR